MIFPICNDTRDCCFKVKSKNSTNVRCTALATTYENDGECVFAKPYPTARPYSMQPREKKDTRRWNEKFPYA